jgi:hypothetical protein
MKIKWLRFSKNDAEHVLLKHKFDEDFKKMRVVEVDKKGPSACGHFQEICDL